MSAERQLLDPATVRAQSLVEVDLGDGTYLCARRLDLPQLIFEGLVPQPLLAAAQRLIDSRGQPPLDRLADLDAADTDEDTVAQLDTLRRYAVLVGVAPPIVPTEDGNPRHLLVTLLPLAQLLAIWNQTVQLPRVGAAAAATFRVRPRADAAPPAHPRQNVRPAAESVAGIAAFRSG